MITIRTYRKLARLLTEGECDENYDEESTAALLKLSDDLFQRGEEFLRAPASTPTALAAKIEVVMDRMQRGWDGGTPHEQHLEQIRGELLRLGSFRLGTSQQVA